MSSSSSSQDERAAADQAATDDADKELQEIGEAMVQSLRDQVVASGAAQASAERQQLATSTMRQFEDVAKLVNSLPSSLFADYEEAWLRHKSAKQGFAIQFFRAEKDEAFIPLMKLWSRELETFATAAAVIARVTPNLCKQITEVARHLACHITW